jgi:ubiquitin-protein ligase
MMEFLLAYEVPAVDIEHGRICLSDGRKRWEPKHFEAHLAWIRKFLGHWPEHVVISA